MDAPEKLHAGDLEVFDLAGCGAGNYCRGRPYDAEHNTLEAIEGIAMRPWKTEAGRRLAYPARCLELTWETALQNCSTLTPVPLPSRWYSERLDGFLGRDHLIVWSQHAAPLGDAGRDWIEVALWILSIPYYCSYSSHRFV